MSALSSLSSRPSVAQQRAEPGPTSTFALVSPWVPDSRARTLALRAGFRDDRENGEPRRCVALEIRRHGPTSELRAKTRAGASFRPHPPSPPGGTANPKNNVIAETAVSSWNEREWRHA